MSVLTVERVCVMIYDFGHPEFFSFHSSVFVVQAVRTASTVKARRTGTKARLDNGTKGIALVLGVTCKQPSCATVAAEAAARAGGAGRAKPARVRAGEIARAAAPPAQFLERMLQGECAWRERMPGRNANLISHARARKCFRLLPTEEVHCCHP